MAATTLLLTEVKEVTNPGGGVVRVATVSVVDHGVRVTINLDNGEIDVVASKIPGNQQGLFVNSNIGNDGTPRAWSTH